MSELPIYARPASLSVATVLMTGLIGALLFLMIGSLNHPQIWAYLIGMMLLGITAIHVVDPGLIVERLRPGPGGRDGVVIHAGQMLFGAHFGLVGLDLGRWHLSVVEPWGLRWIALTVMLAAGLGFVWSMAVNRFFSSVIRLQADRGHQLIRQGPYRFVRHPGYTTGIVLCIASGIALGSWLSSVPTVLFALLIVRRTVLEDRFLLEQLDGYRAYAAEVRYRLVPGVY